MSDVDVSTTEACFVPAATGRIFALLTRPTTEASGIAVTIVPGSGSINSMAGRNRVFARLAAGLAEQGHHVMRPDYGGTGESTGPSVHLGRDHLAHATDVDDTVGWLEDRGFRRHVLVGSCYGALVALEAATRLPSVEQVLLIAAPFHQGPRSMSAQGTVRVVLTRGLKTNIIKGLRDPRHREVYARFVRRGIAHVTRHLHSRRHTEEVPWSARVISAARDAGVDVRLLYGSGDDALRVFEMQRAGALGRVIEQRGVEVRILPGGLHGYPTLASQDEAVAAVLQWLAPVPATQS